MSIKELEEQVRAIETRLNHISTDVRWIKKLLYLVLCVLLLSRGFDIVNGAVINQTQLIKDIKACPYNISDYEQGVFDCSNMAKMLYDYLTEKGYRCCIIAVWNNSWGIGHALLFVEGYAIEPTAKDFAWWYYYGIFKIDKMEYLNEEELRGREWIYPKRW